MKQVKAKIDQLRLMIPRSNLNTDDHDLPIDFEKVEDLLGLTDIVPEYDLRSHAFNGYTDSLVFGDGLIRVNWHSKRKDMGILVDFTASGKAYYESMARTIDIKINWQHIIQKLYKKYAGHTSRVDICVDLISQGFDVDLIYHKLVTGEYQFFNGKYHLISLDRINHIGNANKVSTIYCNSRYSDAFLRIYDKKLAELTKKTALYKATARDSSDWIRVEGEYKGKLARKIGLTIANAHTNAIEPYLANFILQNWTLRVNDQKEN